MKFDIVISNPPYNNDSYIDFMSLGDSISARLSVYIVPAKWASKENDKSKQFRKSISQYIDKIIYYKNTNDIFKTIGEQDGITIVSIDKKAHAHKKVRLDCERNKYFDTNKKFETHTEPKLTLVTNEILELINKVNRNRKNITEYIRFDRNVYVDELYRGESEAYSIDNNIAVMQGNKILGYTNYNKLYTIQGLDEYKCIQSCMTAQGTGSILNKDGTTCGSARISIISPHQVPKGSFQLLRIGTKDEMECLKSYLNSKLMSFMQFIAISGTLITPSFYRFIPMPDCDMQCKFADAQLYEMFNLNSREIEIIENTIKTRE